MILANKNTVPGDKSAMRPGGLRFGTPALTSRNMQENEIRRVGDFLDSALQTAVEVEKSFGLTNKVSTFKDFKEKLKTPEFKEKLDTLKNEVEKFARAFPMPGFC